jgi:hypothetical protein
MAKKDLEYHLICPNCGSLRIKNDLSTSMIAWKGSTRLLCSECEYSATTFPEIETSQIDLFRAEIKTRSKKNAETLNYYSISKGLSNKKISTAFRLAYILPVIIILGCFAGIFVISIIKGVLNTNLDFVSFQNPWMGILLSFVLLIVVLLILKKQEK